MSPVTAHHARAVVRCATDGLLLGLAEAALDHPARSRDRRRLYLAAAAAVAADSVVQEEPWLRQLLEGTQPDPPATEDLHVLLRQGVVACGWGLLVTVVDGPLAPVLRRHGVQRPHALMGLVVGVATALSTLPGWWRQADERAAIDQATARLDEELAELLDQPAG
ncbi:hypothetical protein [Modestobacter sp. SSW1-42]|uniref:hypothetical protein n=1 Tax=Modestobacter sp. SSW1-42 TaxID=596372 RepID=UPI00398645D2